MSESRHKGGSDPPDSGAGARGLSLYRDQFDAPARHGLVPGRRPIVVVLGMHRSGTSLLSNMLHVLGVDMADATDHVSPKNPGGFWERPDLVAIHDEILEAIGRPIARPSHLLPFPPGWWRSKEVQALKPKLVGYLRDQLGGSTNPWGFKDPRTCRLLPLWWEVFRELNVEPVYVTALRAPAEASVSMSQKSKVRKLSVATSELMWLSYNYDIARYAILKGPTLLVDYAEWFADAAGVAHRLCTQLGIGGDLTSDEVAECAASVVQADYRHQFAEAAPQDSVAGMFYRSLTASNPLEDSDVRAVRGQVRFAAMFFKSVAPIVHDMDEAASVRALLESERDDLAQFAAAHAKELTEKAATIEALQDTIGAVEAKLAESEAEHKRFVAETVGSKEALEQAVARGRERSRALLQSAREWRDTYFAERGEPDARIEAAQRAADLQRALAKAELGVSRAEEERARFVDELELRDRTLAALRREQALNRGQKEEARVFTWPNSGEQIEATGTVDQIDAHGVAGWVKLKGETGVVPIVEVRVDGRLVSAQTCLASRDVGRKKSSKRWRFSFAWERFAAETAGKEAVVLVAGIEHELGRATIPQNLHTYHLSPAARASAELGGTIAEAAEYHRWLLEREKPHEEDLARAYLADRRSEWPTITVVVYGDDLAEVARTLQSLQSQVYVHWEAFCVGAPDTAADVDPRAKIIVPDEFEGAVAGLSDDALITFVEAGDSLGRTALLHLADAVQDNPDFALIYSDEDLMDPGTGLRAVPYMKGGWSPDLALSRDYVCRLALVRAGRVRVTRPISAAGVYEVALRAALSSSGPVIHLPFVLYHRNSANAAKDAPLGDVAQGVLDSTASLKGAIVSEEENGRRKVYWPLPDPEPRVSLVIPTRDQVDLLRACVDGFLHETRYRNLEVLIADNDSQEEATRTYLDKVATHPRVQVIACPGPFNFSAINNRTAAHATGELIGLMNNDLKVFDPEWLREMVRHAVRPDVGVVGAKLLYEDGTIQHAGVTLGISLASHLYKFSPGGAEGRQGRLALAQDVSAVTAACLLTRREVWHEVGGLDEDFPVAYNDVDFCLKVRAAGHRVLWTPDAVLYHLESKSRGKDATPEKRERLNQDKARLIERWGDVLDTDPFHSPNFSEKHTDSRLSFPPRAAARWEGAIAAQ